jgi:hypothetical protein
LGFQNVIDAFHVLDGVEIDQRFFLDERSNRGGHPTHRSDAPAP